nr:NAD(P)-binding domain-containing protein [Bowdeniella massiliensis]
MFRVAPQFIRAYLGQDTPPPLRASDVEALREGGKAEGAKHGLVIVGKASGLTYRQLRALRRRRGLREVEIKLPALIDQRRAMHIDEVIARAAQADEHVVLRFSREGSSGDADYSLDERIASGLLAIVRGIVVARPLRFVVSRGGAIATTVARALGVRRAWVRGPLLPGAVSLWQAESGPAEGVPFAVYAGSIGDDESLADVVDIAANVPIPPRPAPFVAPTSTPLAPGSASPGSATSTSAASPGKHLAVIGLGATGLPIAACLAERFSVVGYDVDPARIELARPHGVTTALSGSEAVDGASLVLLNLRDAEQVTRALFDDALVEHLPAGAIVVLCSTIGVAEARELAERLAERQIHLLDAPVSGGPDRARRGELLIAVGAEAATLAAAHEVLDALAARIVHVGTAPGDGQAMKIVNQLLAGVQVLATAESLSLASALGLEREAVVDFLALADTASFVTTERAERMAGGARVHNPLAVMTKDLGIVAATAYHAGVGAPLAGLAEQMFLLASRAGLGEADDSAIINLLEPEL